MFNLLIGVKLSKLHGIGCTIQPKATEQYFPVVQMFKIDKISALVLKKGPVL